MSNEEMDVQSDSSPDEGVEKTVDEILADEDTEDVSEDVKTPTKEEPKRPQEKVVPYDRFQKKVDEVNALKKQGINTTNPMEVVKLAKALEGYSEDEVDFITRNSGSAKIDDIIKASKDEWVNDAIEARRKKDLDKKKVPGSSSPDFSQPSKNYKDIAKMSKEEFRDYAEKQERAGNTGI